MRKLQFKSNINCGSCIANVTNALNETVGEGNWNVNIANKDKILTINSDTVNKTEIDNALNPIGYKIDEI